MQIQRQHYSLLSFFPSPLPRAWPAPSPRPLLTRPRSPPGHAALGPSSGRAARPARPVLLPARAPWPCPTCRPRHHRTRARPPELSRAKATRCRDEPSAQRRRLRHSAACARSPLAQGTATRSAHRRPPHRAIGDPPSRPIPLAGPAPTATDLAAYKRPRRALPELHRHRRTVFPEPQRPTPPLFSLQRRRLPCHRRPPRSPLPTAPRPESR